MRRLSFVYTQLNDQVVLFLTIQLVTRHLFAHSLNIKQSYLTQRYGPITATTPSQSEPGYERILKIPPKFQGWNLNIRLFRFIYKALVGRGILLSADMQIDVFYCSKRLGCYIVGCSK